jgi:hypothetical protein
MSFDPIWSSRSIDGPNAPTVITMTSTNAIPLFIPFTPCSINDVPDARILWECPSTGNGPSLVGFPITRIDQF